jgi:ATP-dependent Clp protease adaptor protein ClpS
MTTELITEKKKKTLKKIQEPKQYKVVIYNDNVTPMDFVIALLMSIFRHTEKDAYDITMTVHNTGSGIAGIYNYEIAEQKAIDSINLARSNDFPLIVKVEEV